MFKDIPFSLQHARRAARGFSLVELLTVVCIMTMVAAFASPALMSSFRSVGVTQAGNRIADMANLARNTAMSKNTIMALVITSADSGPQIVTLLAYDSKEPDRLKWKSGSTPVRLNDAVKVDVEVNGSAQELVDRSIANEFDPLPNKVGQVPLDKCSTLIFMPDGRMKVSGTPDRKVSVNFAQGRTPENYYDLVFNTQNSAFRIVRP